MSTEIGHGDAECGRAARERNDVANVRQIVRLRTEVTLSGIGRHVKPYGLVRVVKPYVLET